jgi:hypothetical protein
MRTSIVFTLVAISAAATSVARGAASPPPTTCDTVLAVDVGKKADAKAIAAKLAAGASKRRGPTELQLRGRGLVAAAITAIGRDPGLAEVATLDAPCLVPAELSALLAPGVFPGLTRLKMQGCRLDDRGAEALAGLDARDAIATLDLAGGKASPAVLKTLLGLGRRAPLIVIASGLRALPTAALTDLGTIAPNPAVTFSVAVRCPDLARLEKTAFLKHVSRLTVACGDSGAKALAHATNTGALRRVSIRACAGDDDEPDYEMTRESALALVEAPTLGGLVGLAFENNGVCEQPGIGRSGLADLLSASFAPKLESLELTAQSLGRKGVDLLASTERLPALRRLTLQGERLVAEDLRALTQSGPLAARLEDLALPGVASADDDEEVDDKTTAALAATLAMPKLRRLELDGRALSPASKERLRRAAWTNQLEVMDFAPPRTPACAPRWHASDASLD